MPLLKSAKKAVRQTERRTRFNRLTKQKMRDAIRAVGDAVTKKDKAAATKALPTAYKFIDIAAKKYVLTKNTASRRKSKLARMIATLDKSAK